MAKTYKATVVVAPREGGHEGWWQNGKKWVAGQQYEDVEMTEDEVHGLARRPGVVVIINGKAVKPTEKTSGSSTPVSLTADELAVVEKHRAERARMAAAQQEAEGSEGGLEFQKKNEALERALTPGSGGGVGGISAATPLQDADILAGKPPPENQTMTGKPIEQPHGKRK